MDAVTMIDRKSFETALSNPDGKNLRPSSIKKYWSEASNVARACDSIEDWSCFKSIDHADKIYQYSLTRPQPTSILAICAAVAKEVCGCDVLANQLNDMKAKVMKENQSCGVKASTNRKCPITFADIRKKLGNDKRLNTLIHLLTELPVLRNEDYVGLSWKTGASHHVDAEANVIRIITGKSKNSVRDIKVPQSLMDNLVSNKVDGVDYLIPSCHAGKLTTSGLTHWMRREFGKGVTITALRNMYVAQRYGKISAEEINHNAQVMGHSPNTAQSVYAKTSGILNGEVHGSKDEELDKVRRELDEYKRKYRLMTGVFMSSLRKKAFQIQDAFRDDPYAVMELCSNWVKEIDQQRMSTNEMVL